MLFRKNTYYRSSCICLIVSLYLFLANSSCKKFVEINAPRTGLISETVFESDVTATAAVSAIYSQMKSSFLGVTATSITILNGLSSDELVPPSTLQESYLEFYSNNIFPHNSQVSSLWGNAYNFIYKANAILDGLKKSTKITQDVKLQLEGEAKFIRAYCHFYLVNLFGDVPYVQTTDYRVNNIITRMATDKVYEGVIADLLETKLKLADDFAYSNGERVRPNRYAASALLARVYLYAGDWENAEAEATLVISKTDTYTLMSHLDDVFLKNNKEAIWQWKSDHEGFNAGEGYFILVGSPTIASLDSGLVNSFEDGDLRRSKWIGSYTDGANTWFYPFKYKYSTPTPPSSLEYSMILRLAEQYLIRAEARAEQDNIGGAKADLNAIRNRANLGNTTAEDRQSLLAAIQQERKAELFTELAHRWFDLKRWGHSTAVLASLKPSWQSSDTLLPIPQSELLINSNLVQNEGY